MDGASVTVYEAKRSVGRKFLVAGKSGLNLTSDLPMDEFAPKFRGGASDGWWDKSLGNFTKDDLREWAAGLGIETFVGSGKKVFPEGMKAAPLLRRWVERLRGLGVEFAVGHRLEGIAPVDGGGIELRFDGLDSVEHSAVVLALGGGSWPQTGSDGGWVEVLKDAGIEVAPLVSANCGWEAAWSKDFLGRVEGKPVKNLVVRAGDEEMHGELVVTRYGFEGGPVYRLGPAIRQMDEPALELDFKPSFSVPKLLNKMQGVKADVLEQAGRRWRLCPVMRALLDEGGPRESVEELAHEVKAFRIPLLRPRPLAEAISSAGGVAWSALDDGLMLRELPRVFVAGEMIDWEAPTGGFLIHGCFVTGAIAGAAAAARIQ